MPWEMLRVYSVFPSPLAHHQEKGCTHLPQPHKRELQGTAPKACWELGSLPEGTKGEGGFANRSPGVRSIERMTLIPRPRDFIGSQW